MSVHAAADGGLPVLLEGIGGGSKDWYICRGGIVQGADFPGSGIAVHPRHLDIHQHHIIVPGLSGPQDFHCLTAISGHIHMEAGMLQICHCHLLVQLIILHQQDAATMEVSLRLFLHLLLLDCMEAAGQHLPQLRQEDRLRTEGGNTGGNGLLLDFCPIVCRYYDNRGTIPNNPSDSPYRFQTVHIRHGPVNDIYPIGIPPAGGKLCPDHCLLAAGGPVRPHAYIPQHFADGAAGVHIIIHYQGPYPLELFNLYHSWRIAAKPQLQPYNKLRTGSYLAFHLDGSSHHIHDILGNGHAQSRTLDAADSGSLLPGKGLKEMLLELLAHAQACVLHMNLILCIALQAHRVLLYPYADGTARIGKLHGIAEKVQQHLVQTQPVAVNILIYHAQCVKKQVQPLGHNVPLENRPQIMEYIRQMDFLFLYLYHAAFDAAHIQHIIY